MSQSIESKRAWMPESLGRPPLILFWEMDEFIPIVLFFIGIIFTNFTLLFIGGGIAYLWLLSKYQSKIPRGFIINFMYFLGVLQIKGFPPYLANTFYE